MLTHARTWMFCCLVVLTMLTLFSCWASPGVPVSPTLTPTLSPLPSPTATTAPTPTSTATPTPTPKPAWRPCPKSQAAPCLLPPPAEAQALRAAFAVLLHRIRLPLTDDTSLLAYDRDASIAAARAYLDPDYDWPLLDTAFIFIYADSQPPQIHCSTAHHCRVTQTIHGIHAVLIFDAEMCRALDSVPCLAPLRADQLDATDNRITAEFHRDPDGGWRLTDWETVGLP